MPSNRIDKLNSLLKEEVAKIIHREIEFKKGVLVTVMKADVSVDVAQVGIYISVLPETEEKNVLKELEKNIYFIQQQVNKKLVLRTVPKLRFAIDDSIRKAAEMEWLFKKV